MNAKKITQAALLSVGTIAGATALDATVNEANAGTDVYACMPRGKTFPDGKTQCIVFSKEVSGRADRCGPSLVTGWGYICGPRDAAIQFDRYGAYVAKRTGTSHVMRMSDGCYDGFVKPYERNGKQQVFCGQYVLHGNTSFWQQAKTGDIKGFNSERSAFSWVDSFKKTSSVTIQGQGSGELVKCAVVGIHTSFFGNRQPKCDR